MHPVVVCVPCEQMSLLKTMVLNTMKEPLEPFIVKRLPRFLWRWISLMNNFILLDGSTVVDPQHVRLSGWCHSPAHLL